MGNIRQTYIKRIAIELVKRFPNEFSTNFDENKKKVSALCTVPTIKMRNRIAGYVTRYRKGYEASVVQAQLSPEGGAAAAATAPA